MAFNNVMKSDCVTCCGTGVLESGGFTPWGQAVDLPCSVCSEKERTELACIGAAWRMDSSLERWFPLTAEELKSLTTGKGKCAECGGNHEPSGARIDCIRHWKFRALKVENQIAVRNADNIGQIRRQLFVPWSSSWNSLVRDETAERENKKQNKR
jgi:hypothetical protein